MEYKKSEIEDFIDIATEFLTKKKNMEALECLNKLLDKDPSNDEVWLLLGIANRRMENLKDAIECFRLATELNTSMLEAWGLLTITLVDASEIEKAQEVIEKAARLNPNDPKFQFLSETLVRVYKKFGPFFK